MTKQTAQNIAARNLVKARKAAEQNINRPGVTEQEKAALERNVEYAELVYKLFSSPHVNLSTL